MTTAKEQKLPSDFQDIESAKRLKSSGQEITLLSSSPYPDNFHVGQAIGNGSCFFDSFRQSLEQQKGIKVTVEQLRNDCKEFAQNNPPKWFIDAISNSHDNSGNIRIEAADNYVKNILDNSKWGDPEVEGRILCGKYGVKLHLIEDQSYFKFLQRRIFLDEDGFNANIKQAIMDSNSNGALAKELQKINSDEASKLLENMRGLGNVGHTHSLISFSGSTSTVNPDYNDQSTIHIINKGDAHFEPLLDINISAKQLQEEAKLQQEQEDFLLAKKLQVDEILEYCNISKDNPQRAKVEKRFDELLAENADREIGDVIGQCVSDIKQHIQRSEEQNPLSLPRCGVEEARVEKVLNQQQTSLSVK